jgi:hypothetical protein
MKELRIILLQAVWGLAMLKAGDLLPLSEARKVNPEDFTPGIVSPLNIKGENGYVVCVFGNRDFASESDEEILSYLKIRAKKDILLIPAFKLTAILSSIRSLFKLVIIKLPVIASLA